ncbi:MAG: 3-dehydroquinate synthase II family protein [Desulfovibrionaceae bacterium]|nr:3-dehydroquinate synthase II family protein [Desulfovibrionaceae bacterium]
MEYIFKSVPYNKQDVASALEAGICSFIIEEPYHEEVQHMGRVNIYNHQDIHYIAITNKDDEIQAVQLLQNHHHVVIQHGCEIIPLENMIAQSSSVWLEVHSYEESIIASQILEHGVAGIVFTRESLNILQYTESLSQQNYELQPACIQSITPIPLAHRVCVDTLTLCKEGQGMLLGNSANFLFLVQAETAHNAYVASRPFRINAGSVHSYAMLPNDITCYLSELKPGSTILLCDYTGKAYPATVGRVKIEKRPMLMITAEYNGITGTIFLQNAETIALVDIEGKARSVSSLSIGDSVLIHPDTAGRHFGMRIQESISE